MPRLQTSPAGVAPRSDFSNYLIGAGAGVGATIPVALEDLQREEDERVQQARSAFRQFVQAHEIVWDDAATPHAHVTAAWIEEINSGDAAVAQLARLYDISVLARPTPDSPVARRQLLEAVLFESGRPILISPPDAPASLGKRVMVAWNGSTETTRAISLAMAFLAKAEWVGVLAVEGGMVDGPSADDVRRMLTRSGIDIPLARINSVEFRHGVLDELAVAAEDVQHQRFLARFDRVEGIFERAGRY